MLQKNTITRLDRCAERINRRYKNYSLLDVGCRTKDIECLLKNCSKYYGTDITPSEGVLPCDLSKTLEFENNQFDIVIAMDILEHLDRPHEALEEIFRVAKKAVYISLPNMFYIFFRWSFLCGRGISGKYTFHAYPVVDRHRWILSCDEAISFIRANASNYTWEYEMLLPPRGRLSKFFPPPMQGPLVKNWPNLFAYGVLFEITL